MSPTHSDSWQWGFRLLVHVGCAFLSCSSLLKKKIDKNSSSPVLPPRRGRYSVQTVRLSRVHHPNKECKIMLSFTPCVQAIIKELEAPQPRLSHGMHVCGMTTHVTGTWQPALEQWLPSSLWQYAAPALVRRRWRRPSAGAAYCANWISHLKTFLGFYVEGIAEQRSSIWRARGAWQTQVYCGSSVWPPVARLLIKSRFHLLSTTPIM